MAAPVQHTPVTNRHQLDTIRELEVRSGIKFASVTHTKNGHLRFVMPNGGLVIASSTPSDKRSMQNILSDIRRVSASRTLET